MLREIVNKLSGWHITIIAVALILVPGAVAASVAFQPVSIVDPATGKKSLIDASRRLLTFDPIAGYRNNPQNFMKMGLYNSGTQCETHSYTVPAGKALVITGITGFTQQAAATPDYSGFFITDGAGCAGTFLDGFYVTPSTSGAVHSVTVDYEPGMVLKSGKTLSLYSINDTGYANIHGYLIPAAAAPAAPMAAEAESLSPKDIVARLTRK